MIDVRAFHGQGSSPARMRYDCGDPDWITDYADWRSSQHREQLLQPFVAVGYSLGGAHIAQLTHYPAVVKLAGIVVYESPVLDVLPAKVDCPVCIIWNDYTPRSSRRREQKARSIAAWNQSCDNVTHLRGRCRAHTRWIPRWPFIGQAWDTGLNDLLGEWVST